MTGRYDRRVIGAFILHSSSSVSVCSRISPAAPSQTSAQQRVARVLHQKSHTSRQRSGRPTREPNRVENNEEPPHEDRHHSNRSYSRSSAGAATGTEDAERWHQKGSRRSARSRTAQPPPPGIRAG